MKKIIFLLMISAPVLAQNVDYNKIVLPDYVKSPDFAEKLVQLAWRNHPGNEVFRREVNVAQATVKQSAAMWLDIIQFQANANEYTINPEADITGRYSFYPRYNVRATINLGQLISIPATNRVNKERVVIAQSNVNAQKLIVRNSVLKAYNEYQLAEKVYKVQSQLLMDNETSHKLIEQRFKNGETNFETYSASLSAYSTMQIGQLEAERNYKNAKLDLEQLIGMRLEDVR